MVMKSAVELLERASTLYGNRIGYEDDSQKITFKELKRLATTIGTNLLEDMPKTPHHSIRPIIVLLPKSVKSYRKFYGDLV